MKPLYKFNKNKTKKSGPPSPIHPPEQGLFPSWVRTEEDSPSSPQGAYYYTYLKDPCYHIPDESTVGRRAGERASGGEAETGNSTDRSHQ